MVNSVHDISSGGLLVALSEMCISGKIGAKIKAPYDKIGIHEYFFGEDQSRYLIEVSLKNKDKVSNILKKNSIYFEELGKTQKDNLDIESNLCIDVEKLSKTNSQWFRNYFKDN